MLVPRCLIAAIVLVFSSAVESSEADKDWPRWCNFGTSESRSWQAKNRANARMTAFHVALSDFELIPVTLNS